MRLLSIHLFALLLLASPVTTLQSESLSSVGYQRVFSGLGFSAPTLLLQRPGDDSRFYLLEKSGRIYTFDNDPTVQEKSLYLDISDTRVDESFEGGLLGMAFDPNFDENRHVYLSYTTSDAPERDNSKQLVSRISRFTANADNSALIPGSELVLFSLHQPHNNHNGGNIRFGPDGYLYAGYGDGGSWGDPDRNGQNTSTLLGAMLRIDVAEFEGQTSASRKYRIPPDNPFAQSPGCGSGEGCPEIYAWGFRNPWRWSFDRKGGHLWVGDVGQGAREEIDLVEKGGNYGWNCYEGNAEYRLKLCDPKRRYLKPVHDYAHMPLASSRDGMAASVTGGYVYRGEEIPELYGSYVYADFVFGKIWVLRNPYSENPENVELFDTDSLIVTFAEDNRGELYFVDYGNDGAIYRFISK
ncbi:MAG: PQQ-dependent sugar dehydrogenase [Gammaproteobacteria bacterium]